MKNEMIICDQQPIYALGCAVFLKEASYIDQYYYIKTIDELIQLHPIDTSKCLMIDCSLLPLNQNHIMQQIIQIKNAIPIILLYNNEDDMTLFKIIEWGFSNIVSRHAQRDVLTKAFEMAMSGRVYFSPDISIKVIQLINTMDQFYLYEKVSALTKEDKYILIRICDQASSKEIASELGYSKRTVEGHRTRLMQLFDVKNLAGLVKVAFETKLYQDYLSNPGLYLIT
jgi:DNA-binding NarL/FixJ family response regulator